jgi:16S rRNA processing protein RimM
VSANYEEPRREDLVALGKITRTQGTAGAVRLLPFFSPASRIESLRSAVVYPDVPQAAGATGAALRRLEIDSLRYHKQFVILEFNGIADMDAASQLREATVYTLTENLWPLEDGEYFAYELVGMRVIQVGESPADIGEVIAVQDGAAHDYLKVRGGGKEFLVPMVRQMVRGIDTDRRVVEVDLPEGLMDL